MSWKRVGQLALGAGLLAIGACGGEPLSSSTDFTVDQFLTGAYAVMPTGSAPAAEPKTAAPPAAAAADPVLVNAVLRTGTWDVGAGGPAATLTLQSSIVTGLPGRLEIGSDAPFTRIVLAVPGSNGYWEIILPSAVTQIQVVVTGANSLPSSQFNARASVGNLDGLGQPAEQAVHAVDLENSDVAVVLRWNAYSDVDLHVTDPNGNEVYFASPTSPEGGRLDLDSNAACHIDGANQEVISWPLNAAPAGEYKVVVDYWSDCGVARSDYSVTYMVRGQTVRVVDGSFEGPTSPSAQHETGTFTVP